MQDNTTTSSIMNVTSSKMIVWLTTYSPGGVEGICMNGEKNPTGMDMINHDPEQIDYNRQR